MIHFFRLVRPINLFIIAITMYGLGWFFEAVNPAYGIKSLPFFLLTLSTVLIAAAGNIINDYFDVRADRINKPDRLIIGRFVKKRVAIVTHWGINVVAFSIAVYLSWTLNSFWYVFIHLLSINILWYYSLQFKRKFLIGNILIAALTGLVPFLVGIYFYQLADSTPGTITSLHPDYILHTPKDILWIAAGLAGFAFLLNFAREVVKDMEDVEGDKVLKSKTLPIVLGYKNSKWIVALILIATCINALFAATIFERLTWINYIPIYLSALFVVLALALLPSTESKSHYKRINALIKLSMIAGLTTPIVWKIIVTYG